MGKAATGGEGDRGDRESAGHYRPVGEAVRSESRNEVRAVHRRSGHRRPSHSGDVHEPNANYVQRAALIDPHRPTHRPPGSMN